MIWLGEFLVHVADQEDTALTSTSGIFPQSSLSDGLGLSRSPQARGWVVTSDSRQPGQLSGSTELVGEVGETQGGEGGAQHPGLLDGERVGVNV